MSHSHYFRAQRLGLQLLPGAESWQAIGGLRRLKKNLDAAPLARHRASWTALWSRHWFRLVLRGVLIDLRKRIQASGYSDTIPWACASTCTRYCHKMRHLRHMYCGLTRSRFSQSLSAFPLAQPMTDLVLYFPLPPIVPPRGSCREVV